MKSFANHESVWHRPNDEFGNVEETGLIITIKDIYAVKKS
jgi:hypothetical protein